VIHIGRDRHRGSGFLWCLGGALPMIGAAAGCVIVVPAPYVVSPQPVCPAPSQVASSAPPLPTPAPINVPIAPYRAPAPLKVPSPPGRVASGCSDGDREGFIDDVVSPNIAGCSGGWSVPGVMEQNPGRAPACPGLATFDTVLPACGRKAGNSSPNPNGAGCNVTDLCAAGWHVCAGAADIASHSPSGCRAATGPDDPPLFFAARQSGPGDGYCSAKALASESNDVFGCGSFGATSPIVACGPIDRFTHNECSGLRGSNWSCSSAADSGGICEAFLLVHRGPDYGGALCCRD
jgi:hypothetical protein